MRPDTLAVAAMVEKAGLNVVGAKVQEFAKYNAFTVFVKVGMLPSQMNYKGVLAVEDYIKTKLHIAGIEENSLLAHGDFKHGLITHGKFRHGANFIIRITQVRFC